jgi:hypothetical protein
MTQPEQPGEAATRWQCPHCRDEMAEKFRRSHRRICAAVAQMERIRVGALLLELDL